MGKIEITDFFSMSKDHPIYTYVREKLIVEGKNPDEDSNFDINTREFRHLSNEEFLKALQKKGYDVLVIYSILPKKNDTDDEEAYLHGYIAYQVKNQEMGIFERIVDKEVRGNHYLTGKLIRDSLEHIGSKGVKKINFDRDSKEILKFLKTKESKYGFSVNIQTKSLSFLSLPLGKGRY
jgi:hypothetical protein